MQLVPRGFINVYTNVHFLNILYKFSPSVQMMKRRHDNIDTVHTVHKYHDGSVRASIITGKYKIYTCN